MTTATDQVEAKVTLNGTTPKRRGRPVGSKNRPKDDTAATPRRRRATAPAKAATQPRTTAPVLNMNSVQAVLITASGFEVLRADGTTEILQIDLRTATLFDRRSK